ncbi:FliH/SctL family protein [Xylophilus sp. ASV27]|uniref:FliH/SctL family protein n=1 Tax=Xylophilus sp. ASV27 TaxID=2795129 RepID=UPI0018EB27B6|nr:FliH/SctL family protein [Xylophilus sp. ASV27]
MSNQQRVLRDLGTSAELRRLPRRPPTSITPASLDVSAAACSNGGNGRPQLGESAKLSAPSHSTREDVQLLCRAAYDEGLAHGQRIGYEHGVQEGRQGAQHEMRQAAQDFATAQVSAALAEAEEQVHRHTRQLHALWERRLALLEAVLQQFQNHVHHAVVDAEDEMLALAFEALCRMLGKQVADLPGLRSQLQTSLEAWHGRAPLSLHLHPDDLSLLQSDPEAVSMLRGAGFGAGGNSLSWVADAEVAIGGCMLRSSEGALDARLETQLDALKSSLLRTRALRRTPGLADAAGRAT